MSGTSIPLAATGINPLAAYQQAQQLALTQAQARQAGAAANLTAEQTQGADLNNQQAALALAYRRLFYNAANPGGAQPAATAPAASGNPLAAVGRSMGANGGSYQPAAGVAATARPQAPPLAQGSGAGGPANLGAVAPSGGTAAAPPAGGSPTQSGPAYGGVVTPGGFSVPAMQYYGAVTAPDPNAAFKNLFGMRNQYLAQTAAQATDNASWNAGLQREVASGWITPDDAARLYNRFDLRNGIIASLADPNAQIGQQTALYGKNMTPTAEGPMPYAPGIATDAATAGAKSGATARAAGQYQTSQFTVPTGQTDASGQPVYRTVTVQNSQIPEFTAANSGARPTTAADFTNPNIVVSADAWASRAAAHESNGNYGATNASGPGGTPTSSAAGGLQFTAPTWVGLVREARPDLANLPDSQIAKMRTDTSPQGIAFQQQMAVAYARQNAPTLTSAGLPINSLTLGVAHEFGGAGAVAVLKAPVNAKITPQLVGQAAYDANPAWQGKPVQAVMADAYRNYGTNPVDLSDGAPTGGAASGAPSIGIPGPQVLSPQQKQGMEFSTNIGDENIKAWTPYSQGLTTDSAAAAKSNGIIDQMLQESQSWAPGKFADVKMNAMAMLDSLGQSLGFKPDNSVGNYQAFLKNTMLMATVAAHAASPASGVQELQTIRSAFPQDTTSPQGLREIGAELQGINDYNIAKAAASANADRRENPSVFESNWDQHASILPFILHRMSTPDAQTLAVNLNKTPEGRAQWANMVQQMQVLDQAGVFKLVGPS